MKLALITGGSRGIGKAIAEELASRQCDLLLVARSAEDLKAVAADLRLRFAVEVECLPLDLSVNGAPEKVFQWCQSLRKEIDVLVNNAGYGLSGSFTNYSPDENSNLIQLNIVSLVRITQLFLPTLRNQSPSYILNIASTAAYQAVPYLSLYAASKSFVLNFSRGLRQELRSSNVSVTCVSPGSTDTDFVVRAKINHKGLKAAKKFNMQPNDVAKIAVQAMLDKKPEKIVGFANKIGAFLAWLMPKTMVEKTAMKIYE
jgi:uncharacterized protein